MRDETFKAALRPLLPADLPVVAAIFRAAIDVLAEEDYDAGQRAAWMERADDVEAFNAGLTGALTLVATVGGVPAGFASLKDNERVEMLYVHPDVARKGVATLLVDALEKLGGARGARRLTVEASDTARPLFENRGYEAQSRAAVPLGEEWLARTHMVKLLAAPEGSLQ